MSAIYLLIAIVLAVPLNTRASCPTHQYPITSSDKEICCDYCDAGEYILNDCTINDPKPKCAPCPQGHYNPPNTRNPCLQCFYCDAGTGSIEEKPCDKSSGVVCRCPNGSTKKNERATACRCAKGRQLVGKECVPCPPGHFSSQENSACQPWTNCSARGEKVQAAGTNTSDVICTKPTGRLWTSTTKLSNLRATGMDFIGSKRNSSDVRRVNKEDHQNITKNIDVSDNDSNVPDPFMNWGTLWLIMVGFFLLSVSGGIIVMMVMRSKPKTGNRRLYVRRCRLPVQEESSSSDSSLAKQCSL